MLLSKIKNIALLTLLSSTIALCSDSNEGSLMKKYTINYGFMDNEYMEHEYDQGKEVTAEMLLKDFAKLIFNINGIKPNTIVNKKEIQYKINSIFDCTDGKLESMFLVLSGIFSETIDNPDIDISLDTVVDANSKSPKEYTSFGPIQTERYILRHDGDDYEDEGISVDTFLRKDLKVEYEDEPYKKEKKNKYFSMKKYKINYGFMDNKYMEHEYDQGKEVTAEMLLKDFAKLIFDINGIKPNTIVNKKEIKGEINSIFGKNIEIELKSMVLVLSGTFGNEYNKKAQHERIIQKNGVVDMNSSHIEYHYNTNKSIKTKFYTLRLVNKDHENQGILLDTFLREDLKVKYEDKPYEEEKELFYITQITFGHINERGTLLYKNKTVQSQRLYDDCFSLFSKTLKNLSIENKFNYEDDLDCLKLIISEFTTMSSDKVEEIKKDDVEKAFFQLQEQIFKFDNPFSEPLKYNNDNQDTSSSYKLEIRHKDCNAGFDENLSFKSFFDKYMKKKTNNDKNEDPQDTSNNKLIIGSVFALVLACLGGIGFYIKQKLVNKKSTRNRLDLSNQEIGLG